MFVYELFLCPTLTRCQSLCLETSGKHDDFSVRTEEDVVFLEHSVPRRLSSHMPCFSLHLIKCKCTWFLQQCLHSRGEEEAGCLLSVCWYGLASV